MKRLIGFVGTSVVLVGAFGTGAQALDCHSEAITASSRLYVSRSFGAFPGSWAAWRKKVKREFGDGWQSWRRAREPQIQCDRVLNDLGQKRWQCTRTAIPCSLSSTSGGGGGGGQEPGRPDPIDLCDQYPVITQRLSRGSSGPQVRMLQCLLRVHGIRTEIDGNFGRSTREAVREFQRNNDLKVDGIVGDLTAERLSG